MAEETGDAELITELRKRNPAALSAVYDRYGNVVYSVFVRITRDESAAELRVSLTAGRNSYRVF